MGYAEKVAKGELANDRELCPEGTFVFQVVSTMLPKPAEGEAVALAKNGDSAGIPEVAVIACPLRDPNNAKSVDRDLGIYTKIAVPFEAEGVKPLTLDTYKKVINRLCNVVGDRLPPFDWKDKAAQQECFSAADALAIELFEDGGDLNGCTFIGQVVHTKAIDRNGVEKTYANLRGIRQELGDATLTEL